jgi:hypothetical protein
MFALRRITEVVGDQIIPRLSSSGCTLHFIRLTCLPAFPTHYLSVRLTLCNLVTVRTNCFNNAGAIIGQIIVGLLCDRMGRKVLLFATQSDEML